MAKFTDDQLTSMAQQFHDMAVNVSQFRLDRIHDGAKLDDPGIVQLFGLQFSLSNTSSSFFLQAAQVTLANADKAAAQVTKATNAANKAIKKLEVINKAVNIASAAGVLAASVMSGDLDQIAQSAKGVFDAIQN
ncbi:MAG TPA: hypothetical protein VLK33_01145 [Terriglobales bacterium]|nr:hypothetical protein [Terriglobales bacterium]